jgi:2-keto-4-pentenoate hydratase
MQMIAVWDDPRVQRGMNEQLKVRNQRLGAGARALGWKVGFGAPAAKARLGIAGPLTGFMTDRSLIQSGVATSLSGWSTPVAEPEIAVYMAQDLAAGAERATAAAAIAALGPAIEVVDVFQPPDEPEAVLSGNIYHRHVILGPRDTTRAGGKIDGLTGQVTRNGHAPVNVPDLQANTGDVVDIVRHVASMLAAFGERLRADDVIICGSVVPPIPIEPRDGTIAFKLEPGAEIVLRTLA